MDLWLDPSTGVQIKNVGVIEVYIAIGVASHCALGATVVMTTKVEDRGADERGRVAATGAGWDAFDLWECPEP